MNILNIQPLLESLKFLGFTDYEAKIYIALLQSHPANGNTIAIRSGVPNPKTYETIRRMQDKGIVFPVSAGNRANTTRYSPLPYEDLLNTREKAFSENLKFLKESLESLSSSVNTDWTELFVIHGYETILETIREGIDGAQSEVILSGWRKQINELYQPLCDASNRGVNVTSLIFDNGHEVPWRNFHHHNGTIPQQRHQGELSIVIDMKNCIILEALNQQPYAVVSSQQAMIQTTRNYIRHDIYINRVISDFGEVIAKKYGDSLDGLINNF